MVNEIYDLFNRLETDRLEIVPRLSNRRANELLEEIQDDASISNFNLSNLSIDELVEDFRLGIDRYAIFLKNQYELIGLLSLDVSDNNDACMIAYYILPKFRRKGFAFEIVSKVIDKLKDKTIKAIVLKDNERSINLLKKLGFEFVEEKVGKKIYIYCSGRNVIRGVNDLQTVNPSLAIEWNYEKNEKVTAMDVMPNSNRKVWWKCANGHEWQAVIKNRNNGCACPYCSKRRKPTSKN